MAETEVNVKIGAQVGEALEGIRSVSESLRSLAEVVGIAFTVEGINHFIESMAQLGLQTERTMAILGTSAEQTLELSGMAKLTGTSMEGLTLSLERMYLKVQNSTREVFSPTADGLKSLGLTAKDVIGTGGDFVKVIDTMHNAISKLNPSMNLTAAVMATGGRGIAQIIPLLRLSSEEWDHMKEMLHKAQDGMADAIPGMAETHARISVLSISVQSLGARIFTVLKPAIDLVVGSMTKWVQSLDKKTIQDFATALIDTLGNALINIVALLMSFGSTLDEVIQKIKTLLIGAGIGAAIGILGGPGGVIVGALSGAGLAAAWGMFQEEYDKGAKKTQDDVEDRTKKMADGIRAGMKSLKDAIAGGDSHGDKTKGQDVPGADTGAKDRQAALMKELEGNLKAWDTYTKGLKEQYTADLAAFRITIFEKANLDLSALEKEKAIFDQTKNYELQNMRLTQAEKATIRAEMVVNDQKYAEEVKKINRQLYAEEQKVVAGYVGALESSFNSSLRGILAGTTSFAAAAKSIFGDMIIYMIEQLMKKFVFEKMILAATTALNAGAAVEKTAVEKTEAVSSIATSSGKFFAALSAYLAGLLGPAAPAAAEAETAGMEAAALAQSGLAQGAWSIPSDMYTKLHEGETVLPKPFADDFRDNAKGMGGGGTTVTINAVDARSVMDLLQRNSAIIGQIVEKHVRNKG